MSGLWFRTLNVWRRRGHTDIAGTPSGDALYPDSTTYPALTTFPKG